MPRKGAKNKLVAAVRVRGRVGVRASIAETLDRLRLRRVNNCTLVVADGSYAGMLEKCGSYIAYGEISAETLGRLLDRKGIKADVPALIEGKREAIAALKESLPIRLKPPKHGYKSTKLSFTQGGDLGYRGERINELITRMI